jgi:hypothetical protein
MGRTLLETAGHYDPDTLKLLCSAFDEAWEDIAENYGHMSVEERRTRLALIILELGNNGGRDIEDIKETALEIMRVRERPAKFNGPSGGGW